MSNGEGPAPSAADGALSVFDNGAADGDWVEQAIADGILTREHAFVGLNKEDVDRLTRSRFSNCTLLVRFRSEQADGRMVMSANDVIALSSGTSDVLSDTAFGYEDVRDIFPMHTPTARAEKTNAV